jgi:hypothetical protein
MCYAAWVSVHKLAFAYVAHNDGASMSIIFSPVFGTLSRSYWVRAWDASIHIPFDIVRSEIPFDLSIPHGPLFRAI